MQTHGKPGQRVSRHMTIGRTFQVHVVLVRRLQQVLPDRHLDKMMISYDFGRALWASANKSTFRQAGTCTVFTVLSLSS